MMISISEQFISEIEAFLSEVGMEPTIFGRQALNDPNFVFQIRKGRSPSARTIDQIRHFMSQYNEDAA